MQLLSRYNRTRLKRDRGVRGLQAWMQSLGSSDLAYDLVSRLLLYMSTTPNATGENEANVRYLLDTGLLILEKPKGPLTGGPGLTGSAGPMLHGGSRTLTSTQRTNGSGASNSHFERNGVAEGGIGGEGKRFEKVQWLTCEEADMLQRWDPRGDTIGFFAARFRKRTILGA